MKYRLLTEERAVNCIEAASAAASAKFKKEKKKKKKKKKKRPPDPRPNERLAPSALASAKFPSNLWHWESGAFRWIPPLIFSQHNIPGLRTDVDDLKKQFADVSTW